MSAWEAIFLTGISFGSMWACYRIGLREGMNKQEKKESNE